MIAIEILFLACAFLVLVPVLVLFTQVIMAMLPRQPIPIESRRPVVAVLVPAHNEVDVIADTLASLLPQLLAGDRLLVVADNCTDDTAKIAAGAGAEVVERQDIQRRGKGYALDFGMRHLERCPPEVVVVVDADCQAEAGTIDRLARECLATWRPVQALYLMHAPSTAGLKMQIAEFAWQVKNWVRPLGSQCMGLPCQLMGTGMAFPWHLAEMMKLANASIVEDMQLGIDLALNGYPALFCPEALVTSNFPVDETAVKSQRTRWEHGHMGMMLRALPGMCAQAFANRDIRLLGLALDLAVPPLALLVALAGIVFVLAWVGYWGGGFSALAPLLAMLNLVLIVTAILLAWHGWGRKVVSFAALLSVPFYILGKLPLYLKFWTSRQQEWVRTERK